MFSDFLSRFNLFRAARDFRQFLMTRRPYELWFMLASFVSCIVIVWAFIVDSHVEERWQRPEIIWVKDWRLDRTDEQIIAQQKIDQAKKDADAAELKKLQDAKKAQFKKLNDQLKPWL